ncbi:hypothetical protein VXE65_32930 [Mycolicibacterium conceptionense]|uniref:hypothetical protein n=1 Tax=Mycolicibacterium conceptionense TaxID=451644 RepID=UPI003204C874
MSNGGASLDVSHAGMAIVAATMNTAAGSLAALAATPPVHAPLAGDEVSTSAAARLTEHGGVLASRATDGAAVLTAAAQAVAAADLSMAETDHANATALTLTGYTAPPVGGPASAGAVKTNAVSPDTPIAPMAPRPGEVTAALIEAGSASTGTTFTTACRGYQSAFESCAVAARHAENAVSAAITGRTGPRLSAALNKFAAWADEMANHSATLAQSAQEHGNRFQTTQNDTPRTQQFSSTRQSLTQAQLLNLRTGGMASGLVTQFAGHLQQLDSTATKAGVSYHLAELPQAPPPPPPVTDIVNDGATPSTEKTGQPGERKPEHTDGKPHDDAKTDPSIATEGTLGTPGTDDTALTDLTADPLLSGDPSASPLGADPMQQIAPMAAMLPSMLAGTVGGAVGAVTSIPQKIGEQVMGTAQQLIQGASASMTDPEDLGLGTDPLDPGGLSGLGGGLGGGGGGGGTEPAGLNTSLPPSTGGALAAASAPAEGPALPTSSGTVRPPTQTAAAAGMGGMMMPPMMGGMGGMGAGGAGTRPTSPPDKTVKIPEAPNEEPVKGEVERRQTVTVDGTTKAEATGTATPPGRPRRRVVVPTTDPEGQP